MATTPAARHHGCAPRRHRPVRPPKALVARSLPVHTPPSKPAATALPPADRASGDDAGAPVPAAAATATPAAATATTGPWQLLREAGACLHPAVTALQDRVDADDGPTWLAAALANQPGAGDELAQLVVDALRAAAAPDDRAGATAAALDRDVLAQVWRILAQHAPTPAADVACRALLASEPAGASAFAPAAAAARTAPQRVGKYDLLRPIGLGASGTVYEGRHADNGRFAAVKVLRLEAWDPHHVERFRDEARIVAQLDHPAIVRVLDSGVEEFGGIAVPYLVAELVRGQRFTTATAHWPLPDVLRAFGVVCAAVAHAHQRGVLHRDLKSSNILVDDAGGPHLLDFGIARMVDGRTRGTTQTGMLLGTPSAMSPEQAAGAPVDATAEVWSLGALLFESLAGVPPHDLTGRTGMSALRRIAEDRPRRLDALRPDLPHDVVAVVHKALATDRRERYAAVTLLADDVQRLLAGDPVAARPPTAWRVLRHVARRHRRLAVATAVVLATALVGIAAVTTSWWHEQQARRQTVAAMEQTLQFAGRLVELATPSADMRRLLADALTPVANPDLDAAPDATLRVEGRLREHLGDLACRTGDMAAARDQRRRALALEQARHARGADNDGDLARALVKLADVDRPTDPDRAHGGYEAAHALLAAIAARPDATLPQLDDLGWSHERLAAAAIQQQDWPRAETHLTARIELARRLLAQQPDGLRHYGLACGLIVYSHAVDAMAPHADSTRVPALAREACELFRGAIAADPARVAFLDGGIGAHLWWAEMQRAGNQPAGALATVEHTRAWLQTLRAGDPARPGLGALEVRRIRLTIACLDHLGEHRRAADEAQALVAAWHDPALQVVWSAEPPGHRALDARCAWLAGWRAGDEALRRRAAEAMRTACAQLPQDAPSVIALATYAAWAAPTDRPFAEQILATARAWLADITARELATAEAHAAVAMAAAAIAAPGPPHER